MLLPDPPKLAALHQCKAAARMFSVAYRDWCKAHGCNPPHPSPPNRPYKPQESLVPFCICSGCLVELVAKLCGGARWVIVGIDTVFLAERQGECARLYVSKPQRALRAQGAAFPSMDCRGGGSLKGFKRILLEVFKALRAQRTTRTT